LSAPAALGGNTILAGPLPASLSALPRLSVVHLQGSGHQQASLGSIPAEWGAAPNLRVLKLEGAAFSSEAAGGAAPSRLSVWACG
jgi:hypothetical protein